MRRKTERERIIDIEKRKIEKKERESECDNEGDMI
jgi:hypothetical protein